MIARRERDDEISRIIDTHNDAPVGLNTPNPPTRWKQWPDNQQVPLVTGANVAKLTPLGWPKERLREMRKSDPDRLAALQGMAKGIRNAAEKYATVYKRVCEANGHPI